jgi:uncharacterized protein
MIKRTVCFFFFLIVLTGAVAGAQEIPAPQGYVSDYADILSPATRDQLTALHGKVGAILDEFVTPEFRQGRYHEGIYKGVWAVALVIAKDAGVELTGQAPIDRLPDGVSPMSLVIALVIIFLVASFLMRSARRQRGKSGFPWWIWLALSSGGKSSSSRGSSSSFGGGFSRGGFGGFGGGRTGGGGAGRGW